MDPAAGEGPSIAPSHARKLGGIPSPHRKSAATSPSRAPGKASAVTAPKPDFEFHRRTGADEPHHPRGVRPSYPSRPAAPPLPESGCLRLGDQLVEENVAMDAEREPARPKYGSAHRAAIT